jgi:hypothetical protein
LTAPRDPHRVRTIFPLFSATYPNPANFSIDSLHAMCHDCDGGYERMIKIYSNGMHLGELTYDLPGSSGGRR